MTQVLVGIPWERNVSSTAAVALMSVAVRAASQGHVTIHVPYMATDRARNAYAHGLFAPENARFDALLMLDSDMIHAPDIVERLAAHLDDEHQIVGALGFRRGPDFEPCAYTHDEPGKAIPIQEWNCGLVEVEAMGFTGILIGRQVLETMRPKKVGDLPWFYSPISETTPGGLVGHDIAFCRRARALGYRLWCDTDLISPHLIESAVTPDVYLNYLRHIAQQQQQPVAQPKMTVPEGMERAFRRQSLTVE